MPFLSWANHHPPDESFVNTHPRIQALTNRPKFGLNGAYRGLSAPIGRSSTGDAILAQVLSGGPLGMCGPCLLSFTPFEDRLVSVGALFLHMFGPDLDSSRPSPLGLFCLAQYGVTLCFFAHFECVFHVFHKCPHANGQTPKLVEIVSSKALCLSLVLF